MHWEGGTGPVAKKKVTLGSERREKRPSNCKAEKKRGKSISYTKKVRGGRALVIGKKKKKPSDK